MCTATDISNAISLLSNESVQKLFQAYEKYKAPDNTDTTADDIVALLEKVPDNELSTDLTVCGTQFSFPELAVMNYNVTNDLIIMKYIVNHYINTDKNSLYNRAQVILKENENITMPEKDVVEEVIEGNTNIDELEDGTKLKTAALANVEDETQLTKDALTEETKLKTAALESEVEGAKIDALANVEDETQLTKDALTEETKLKTAEGEALESEVEGAKIDALAEETKLKTAEGEAQDALIEETKLKNEELASVSDTETVPEPLSAVNPAQEQSAPVDIVQKGGKRKSKKTRSSKSSTQKRKLLKKLMDLLK